MRALYLLAIAALLMSGTAARAETACSLAATKALDSTLTATNTLVAVTNYMKTHDDLCDGNAMALQQQDGDAVDKAWSDAIAAQSVCFQDKAELQMNQLIVSLHNRRLRISAQIDMLKAKCE